jgi:hypothetical protein
VGGEDKDFPPLQGEGKVCKCHFNAIPNPIPHLASPLKGEENF